MDLAILLGYGLGRRTGVDKIDVESVLGYPDVTNEAARAAVVQAANHKGRWIKQAAGTVPGYYVADGAGGWQFVGDASASSVSTALSAAGAAQTTANTAVASAAAAQSTGNTAVTNAATAQSAAVAAQGTANTAVTNAATAQTTANTATTNAATAQSAANAAQSTANTAVAAAATAQGEVDAAEVNITALQATAAHVFQTSAYFGRVTPGIAAGTFSSTTYASLIGGAIASFVDHVQRRITRSGSIFTFLDAGTYLVNINLPLVTGSNAFVSTRLLGSVGGVLSEHAVQTATIVAYFPAALMITVVAAEDVTLQYAVSAGTAGYGTGPTINSQVTSIGHVAIHRVF